MNRNKERTERWAMFVVNLIELGVVVALAYYLFSWLAQVIAQVIV